MKLIFEKSVSKRAGFGVPKADVPKPADIARKYKRKEAAALPELSELDVVRHYTKLSQLNFSIDTNFYPLGSCTMKYNPKFTEKIASLPGFSDLHPIIAQLGNGRFTQGALEVIYETEKLLCEITGMDEFSLEPLAGAHAELTGMMLVAAFHKQRGSRRRYVIVPDSSHGTNPASCSMAGFDVVVIPTGRDGCMDLAEFKKRLTSDLAAVILTCPNTLGIFNPHIKEVAKLAHQKGALMYYDGANLNGIIGKCRPGDVGFDIVHLNLHKTFSTPHGGGGPGAGPLGVRKELARFLPIPRIIKQGKGFRLNNNHPDSIGYVAPFYGNFGVILKAYAYILFLGKAGLIEATEAAVLNANYCQARLKEYYNLPYERICKHETVLSASLQTRQGIHALDIAKYLIDQGIHPPTIYFPLNVKEALMIEPTETESKQTLDDFISAMIDIAKLTKTNPRILKDAPQTTPVRRLDEVGAARQLNLCWHPEK